LPRDCSYNDFLANTPELNIRIARALAARVKIDLKAGLNRADTKRAKRSEMTLGELFEEYVERHLIPHKKKGIDTSRENFQRYFGTLPNEPRKKHGKLRTKTKGSVNWQNRPIGNITKAEVQRAILDLGREGSHCTANPALSLIRSLYNRAIEWGVFDKPNPAAEIKKFNSRDRALEKAGLPYAQIYI
jgi:hypothetical protein